MIGLSWRFNLRVRSLGKALSFWLLAAIAAAFLFLGSAKAQEEPEYGYVDLVMLYEQGPSGQTVSAVVYSVQNVGTATAAGVTVKFTLEELVADDSDLAGSHITGKETVDATKQQSFTWEVGTIAPGGTSNQLIFSTNLHTGYSTPLPQGWKGQIGSISAAASTTLFEPDMLLANNVAKVYSYATGSTGATRHIRRNSGTNLLLLVDDLRPAAGGDVNFDLTADNCCGGVTGGSAFRSVITDIIVAVELSDGLEFKSGWTPPTEFVPSGQSATWTLPGTDNTSGTPDFYPSSYEIEIEAQLTTDALTDIPLEERCITARVAGSTPPSPPKFRL